MNFQREIIIVIRTSIRNSDVWYQYPTQQFYYRQILQICCLPMSLAENLPKKLTLKLKQNKIVSQFNFIDWHSWCGAIGSKISW